MNLSKVLPKCELVKGGERNTYYYHFAFCLSVILCIHFAFSVVPESYLVNRGEMNTYCIHFALSAIPEC